MNAGTVAEVVVLVICSEKLVRYKPTFSKCSDFQGRKKPVIGQRQELRPRCWWGQERAEDPVVLEPSVI